jgi:hypothetical protein
LVYDDANRRGIFTSRSRLPGERLSHDLFFVASAMNPQISHEPSYSAGTHQQPLRMVRSSFCIMPHAPRPARTASFIFGRSDARYRPLLNQEERDRLHLWAMIVTLSSSAVGTTLLLASFLR